MSVHDETPKQEYRRQKTVDRISTTNKKRIQKTEVRRQTPEYRSQETEDRIKNQKTRIQETEVRRPSKTTKKGEGRIQRKLLKLKTLNRSYRLIAFM